MERATEGLLIEEIPQHITDLWTEALREGDEPWAIAESDMTLTGRYGRSWLIASPEQLLVVDEGFSPTQLAMQVPCSDLRSAKAQHLYGNGVLLVSTEGRSFDIIRYSKSHDDKFDAIAESLSRRIEGTEASPSDAEKMKHNENRCPQCGRFMAGWRMVCPACTDRRKVFTRLLGHVIPHRRLALTVLALSLALTAIGLIPPLLTKTMLDTVLPHHRVKLLKWVVLGILGVHASTSLVNGVRGYLMAKLGQRITLDMRTKVYTHLQSLSVNYYDRRQTGWIMQRVTGDVSNLQGFMVNGVQDIIIQVLTLICIGIILFTLNWRLAIVTLFPTPFVALATSAFAKKIRVVWQRIWRRQSDLNATLADTIPGIRVVKAFGREKEEIEKFYTKQESLFSSHLTAARMSSTFYPIMGFATAIGSVFVWGYGGMQVINSTGGITTGTLIAFISYMWQFYGPVQQLSRLSGTLQEAATAAERVFEVLDTQPQIFDTDNSIDVGTIRGSISFRNVGFSYEKGEQILKGVSLDIKEGEMIGLVGASGAGKTTLINLLSRFYDSTEGEILIDDVNIKDIKLSCLREQMAVVLQEPFLFHGSISDNIAYGRDDVSREEIIWAARMANAHEFIVALPDGYETRLGERGIGLSGGQKQRISIARAILKDPRILILDEATSAVDTQTESLIQEAISRLVKGRTTIAIAHRLSTLKHADRIAVLKDGELVEIGTHDELLDMDGVFGGLVKMQQEIARSVAV